MAYRSRSRPSMDSGRNSSSSSVYPDDVPPNSRLFIVCDRSTTEDEFREVFGRFGNIEDVWIVKDKNTGESKGVAYIKYAKTSHAMEALECLDGQSISDGTKPMKVLIANNRADGSKRDYNEQERLLRLFVVVPKTYKADEVREQFNEFGEVADVTILKNRDTGESKGFAYVRFKKALSAAKAYENCDRSFRPVFAKPRPVESATSRRSSGVDRDQDRDRDRRGSYHGREEYGHDRYGNSAALNINESLRHISSLLTATTSSSPDFGCGISNMDGSNPTLKVYASTSLTERQLQKVFDLVPGLESCNVHERNFGPHEDLLFATVRYKTAQSTSWAKQKLNQFEYPMGMTITIRTTEDHEQSMVSASHSAGLSALSSIAPDISKLADVLVKAQSILQNVTGSAVDDYDPSYCSVRLPPHLPLAPVDSKVERRLFIVCSPRPPDSYALRDVFGRFGNMIDVYILGGKSFGYVKYASAESAERAMATIHGQEIMGMRIKVMPAEERVSTGAVQQPAVKRQRMDNDIEREIG